MSWVIKSKATNIDRLLLEESLFFTGNGYLGVRGNLEESSPSDMPSIRGTYINGFYDDVPISYGEKLHGFPDTQQKQLNMIDAQSIDIIVGVGDQQETLSLWNGTVLDYERSLHMDKGFTERRIHWKSSYGHELRVTFKRLASQAYQSLFLQHIELESLSGPIPVTVQSRVNGHVENHIDQSDPRVGHGHAKRVHIKDVTLTDDYKSVVKVKTYASNLTATARSHINVDAVDHQTTYHVDEHHVTTTIAFTLDGQSTIEKRTYFSDSRQTALSKKEQHALDQLPASYFFRKQAEDMANFWSHADIQIGGDTKLQEGIRFNLYHLFQSAGRDGQSNIAAKGLSGEGYEGHYFWDTEIYMLPFFTMTQPDIAKQLLLYRYSILDAARNRAREMGHSKGALFPWRTISGSECSSFFPAGSAQYHISADIAYSFVQYYLATNDTDFMVRYGGEVLVETARLWLDTGHFASDGSFRIDAVTGPDEYTCIVNNNYYTNAMAKFNLTWAVKAINLMKRKAPEHWHKLQAEQDVTTAEVDDFLLAAENMYLPVDDTLKINPQDDTFLNKGVWDIAETPKEQFPLLLHYHPLTLYRYQVCKQADTVLAHFLLEDEQSEDVMKHSYLYYEQVTTFDSSLSFCVFSMMAARLGDLDKAYNYFIDTVRMDLDNTHGNTKDGLHMANMGGTWLAIVAGFAGMRIKESGLHFRPQLPTQWNGYAFPLHYQGRQLHIELNGTDFVVTMAEGEPVNMSVWDTTYKLSPGQPVQVCLT
ncbi:glycoside hydrolase family 65 protein [Lentibacillus saliphilus]|uniref:glycoside hydrolase family 65 protein n=1 Tax=Lentibacillus saliphilus TaxID=2737028 RepID=UPI001C2F3ECF|nr:glycosyl hydrolase family 65 protein [Lentibacillus saliphilus]